MKLSKIVNYDALKRFTNWFPGKLYKVFCQTDKFSSFTPALEKYRINFPIGKCNRRLHF